MKKPSFNIERLLQGGRIKHLYELLLKRHHADPDPPSRARADIDRVLEHAFQHFAKHFAEGKNSALTVLAELQRRAFDFYDEVLRSRGTPDIAKLEKILGEMDAEMDKLSRNAGDVAETIPKPDRIALSPPPAKAWDDPTLTFDEFAAQYRARHPDSPLAWDVDQLRKHYDAKQRLNPDTGQLKKPVVPLPPPQHVDLTTDPAKIAKWDAYKRGESALPCFPADTLVHTPGGTVRIEVINVGDEVLSWNDRTGIVTPRRVTHVYSNWTTELVVISTDNGAVSATRAHPFWSSERRDWVAASEVTCGSHLRQCDGRTALVASVERVMARERTFNLEVDEHHMYFVAEAGLLVHNENVSSFTSREARFTNIYIVKDLSGDVVYVGQTVQTDVWERLREHINDPGSALYAGIDRPPGVTTIDVHDPLNIYTIQPVEGRMMTPYEAAVWEQHFIDRNGGVGSENLLNRQVAITPENYVLYRNAHNPC